MSNELIIIRDQWDLLPVNERAFTEVISPGGYVSPLVKDDIWEESPPVLLPYQQRWINDRSRVKICEKSRRIGLSWGEAADAVLTAMSEMNVYYCGFNYDMSYTFIRDCEQWAKAFNLAVSEIQPINKTDRLEVVFEDEDKDILGYKIKFASGYEIKALSSKPTNFRSKQGKVILDEFAFHNDPEGLMKAALALLMWGGRLSIISTHNGIDSHFNHLINDIKAGNNDFSLHKITFNDALEEGLYKRICLVQGVPWTLEGEFQWVTEIRKEYGIYAEEELDCIPSVSTNLLFNNDAIVRNAIGKWEDKRKSGYYLAGIDPNFGSDDNHICSILNITKFPISLAAEYANNNQGTIINQEGTVKLIKDFNPHLIAIESNSGGKVIAENLIRAMPNKTIETINTNHINKIVNTDRMASMIDSNDLIFPPDWKGINEMRHFSKKLRAGLGGIHDDRILSVSIALAFLQQALESLPRPSKAVSGKNKMQTLPN